MLKPQALSLIPPLKMAVSPKLVSVNESRPDSNRSNTLFANFKGTASPLMSLGNVHETSTSPIFPLLQQRLKHQVKSSADEFGRDKASNSWLSNNRRTFSNSSLPDAFKSIGFSAIKDFKVESDRPMITKMVSYNLKDVLSNSSWNKGGLTPKIEPQKSSSELSIVMPGSMKNGEPLRM